MADVATAPQPDQQVPLDTIPISPTGGSGDSNEKSTSAAADGEVRTVFHDPENFNVKHPLMNTWSLWFTKPPSGKVCGSTSRVEDWPANMCRATTGRIC
jgi:translation initiation factor 4E